MLYLYSFAFWRPGEPRPLDFELARARIMCGLGVDSADFCGLATANGHG